MNDWKHACTISVLCVNSKRSVYATVALNILLQHLKATLGQLQGQGISIVTYKNTGRYWGNKQCCLINSAVFPFYSSHSSPCRHTQWLHPAQVPTAAPTTVAAVTVAPQAGTSSAKPTSTSEVCPLQPQIMTLSSSVSREYHSSSPHYLLPIDFHGLDCHFCDISVEMQPHTCYCACSSSGCIITVVFKLTLH